MKFISLFAGIGGLDLGLERAGMECVAQVEIDDFCQKVLTKHWANVPKFKDVRDVGKHNLPTAELICGGFPCQDVSLAGSRAGLEGKRSTLWKEYFRIICEIRPGWVVAENVSGLFSANNGQFFGEILNDLASIGYDAEWNVLSAAAVGAPQLRERVFIVAYPKRNGWNRRSRVMGNSGRNNLFGGWNTKQDRKNGKHFWIEVASSSKNEIERPNPVISGEWAVESAVGRVANGVSGRLDRLHALGNAVVPQVAEFVGRSILQAENAVLGGSYEKAY